MKDIEHPEFIIKVMIFNEYISDVCETQGYIHQVLHPLPSLTAGQRTSRPRKYLESHLAISSGSFSVEMPPSLDARCAFWERRILRNLRAFNGVKTEERIDRRYIIYLQDSASDIPKGEPTAKRHRGTGCSCADGPLQTIQDPMSRATHMLVNVDHLRQVEVKTQMLWLLLLHQTSLAPALPKEVMLPLAK